jgi:hypothetical protein
MGDSLVKDILIKLQFLSERDFQLIEAEIEKQRRLRQLLMENQQQLPLFNENFNERRKFV